MRTLITNVVAATASIVLTAGLVAFASPAAAAQIERPRQRAVQLADLDFATAEGRLAAEHRVRIAADRVCRTNDERATMEAACRSRAASEALALLDRRIASSAGGAR